MNSRNCFEGYGPPYKCAPLTNKTDLYRYGMLNNISASRITYDKCNIEIQSKTSNTTSGTYKLTCPEGYQYDSKQETIVTEGFVLTAQVYITELFPKEQRGTVSGFGGLGWSFTMVLLSLWGYLMRNTSWRYIHLFFGLFGVPVMFTYWIIDESLRWLIANKRADEAKTLVRKIAKFNKVDLNDILPLIQHDGKIDPFPIHQNPKEEKRENILTIARHKILLKTAFIMAFTWYVHIFACMTCI
ncbi:SLC22A4_5 [Mytilus coruscus]|uniref:SLC22A4_5 n=1 Tax=Mytilus coruscus TaxID=42192 RepID=A0A6J8CCB0_MYTCO|nr:SLC22A4_5 [Mytilus coruscus]